MTSDCLWPVQSPGLFPAYAAQHSIGFDPARPLDPPRDFPGVALPDWFAKAVRKRRMEFLAGRYCAREALRAIAPELAATPISSGRNREPLWPPGIVGAITHTDCYASVVVARSSDARGLGLDAEVLIDPDSAARLRDQVASPDELESLARATGWPLPLLLTVVFSAKESLFKCLYPHVGRFFDFRDAAVHAIDHRDGRGLTAHLLTKLTADFPVGYELHGRFARHGTTVSTAIILPG
jgi:enterobactin synthetase component D